MVNACCSEHAYHNESNGAKSLNKNLGIEVNKSGGICSLKSVNANACKLEKHSLLEVKVVYYKVGRALSAYEKVGCKPTGKGVCIAVMDKSENSLLVAKVSVCGLVTANEAFATADNGSNDLVANLYGISGSICLYIFTESNDLTCSLVTESYRDKSEGIALPLMNVSSAYATAFNLNENIVVTNGRHRKFLYLDGLGSCEHCNLRSSGNLCRRSTRSGSDLAENLTNYPRKLFEIDC